TSEPADFFGIKNRGRLLPGMAADIVAFDYNTVGSDKRGQMRNDLPGGGRRLVMPARGIEHVFVNGEWLYDRGKANEELHGEVLRSGPCWVIVVSTASPCCVCVIGRGGGVLRAPRGACSSKDYLIYQSLPWYET